MHLTARCEKNHQVNGSGSPLNSESVPPQSTASATPRCEYADSMLLDIFSSYHSEKLFQCFWDRAVVVILFFNQIGRRLDETILLPPKKHHSSNMFRKASNLGIGWRLVQFSVKDLSWIFNGLL